MNSDLPDISEMPPSRTPRLAIFGGSFDPVHSGHISLAQQLVMQGIAQEILFVPARRPPHKTDRLLTPAFCRLEMLTLAIEPYEAFSVSDIELVRTEGYSYTFDTMTMLRQVFPDRELRFLIGMDSLRDLHKWYRAPDLVWEFEFIVCPRPGYRTPSYAELAGKFGGRNARKLLESVAENLPTFDISATEIRERCMKGQPLEDLCPQAVVDYIHAKRLYGSTAGTPK